MVSFFMIIRINKYKPLLLGWSYETCRNIEELNYFKWFLMPVSFPQAQKPLWSQSCMPLRLHPLKGPQTAYLTHSWTVRCDCKFGERFAPHWTLPPPRSKSINLRVLVPLDSPKNQWSCGLLYRMPGKPHRHSSVQQWCEKSLWR